MEVYISPNIRNIIRIFAAAVLAGTVHYFLIGLDLHYSERDIIHVDGQALKETLVLTKEFRPTRNKRENRFAASKEKTTPRKGNLETVNASNSQKGPIRMTNPFHDQTDKLYNISVSKVDSQWFYSPWELERQMKYQYDCAAVKRGDLSEMSRVSKELHNNTYTPAKSEDVYKWVENCSAYRPYVEFRNKYTTQEEREFPIAFGLRMHQGVEQAEQLLRHIYAPQNIYCIYIDKKSPPEIHKTMRQIAKCFDNIFVATKLENFYYGWSSHVQADKQCMADALNKSKDWNYFINLVGEAFPLKTNLELVRILKALAGRNGIETIPARHDILEYRVLRVWKLQSGRVTPTDMVRPPYNGTALFYKGSVYGLFSRNFVKWNLEANFPRSFEEYLAQGTWNSDEIYWGTVARQPNTPGGFHRDVLLFGSAILWSGAGLAERCHGRNQRGVCIFAVNNLKWLYQQPEGFANKFKLTVDPVAVDCLAEWMTLKRVKGVVEFGHPVIK